MASGTIESVGGLVTNNVSFSSDVLGTFQNFYLPSQGTWLLVLKCQAGGNASAATGSWSITSTQTTLEVVRPKPTVDWQIEYAVNFYIANNAGTLFQIKVDSVPSNANGIKFIMAKIG